MTRARALKQVIRARAAKTGERYTTARRHVLRELNVPHPVSQAVKSEATPPERPAKRTISESSVLKKTGHDLAYWFGALDAFGAVDKGHTASARYLHDVHGVDGWYAQGITVSYERQRGVRGVNQRCDGAWEVSVSKTIAATTPKLVAAFSDARKRHQWISEADPALIAAMSEGLADKKSKGWVVRADGVARHRYRWNGTVVQLYAYPKPGGKIALTVQHTKLANAGAVEKYRAEWKAALGLLADYFTA
jgi:hypothetical protein